MATCTYCGKSTGWFKSTHPSCVAAAAEREEAQRRLAEEVKQSAVSTVAVKTPTVSFAFGRDFTCTYTSNPAAVAVARLGLVLGLVAHEALPEVFVNKIAEDMSSGLIGRATVKWAQASDAPYGLDNLNPDWLNIIMTTVEELVRNRELPEWSPTGYLMIDSYGCGITSHRRMDQFKAKIDDPLWQTMTLPFDWGCRCRIMMALEKPKRKRKISAKILERAARWRTSSPREALLALPKPPR